MKDSEKKGKKVLHISKYYYPYLGGTESVLMIPIRLFAVK